MENFKGEISLWTKLGGLEFWLGELFTWSGLRDLQIYSPKFIFKKLYI